MKLKFIIKFIVALVIWFGIFSTLSYATNAEWLIVGKYYLTAIVMSFLCGCHVGVFALKKALIG